MKNSKIFLLITLLPTMIYPREVVDTIKAVIFGPDKTDIILLSDIARPSIDGSMRSLEDRIFEKLVLQDAIKHKIMPSEEDIDRHLAAVMRENKIGEAQLREIFANAGYSYQEGREQFGIMSAVNSMIEFKVRSGLFVSQREVEDYYNKHPEIISAQYYLQRAVIPFSSTMSHAEQADKIRASINSQKGAQQLTWTPPFWIDHGQIADDKEFIFSMNPGDVSEPVVTQEGFELFKLLDKKPEHVRTLDERYREISEILRQPKFQELLANYKEDSFARASILYF